MADAGIDQADGGREQVGFGGDLPVGAGLSERLLQLECALVVLVQGHQGLAVKIRRLYLSKARQRAVARYRQVHAQGQVAGIEVVKVILAFDHADIELALGHPVPDLARAEGLQRQPGIGIVGQVLGHDPGHGGGREPRHAAQDQLARAALAQAIGEFVQM